MFCEANKIFVTFDKINVLKDISLNIESGKITAIIGKNGSGKSTLLRCLNCLVSPTSGFLKHKFNTPFPMLFQKPVTFQNTIQYNFEILSKIKKIKPSMRWYKSFHLNRISKKNINKVSGGEKQKTYLSRIMSVDPQVMLMDEPSQNLDSNSNQMLIDLMLDEKKNNKTIIFSSHDIEIVKYTADKIILLDYGKIIYDGVPKKFF